MSALSQRTIRDQSAAQVRTFLSQQRDDTLQLVDVREPDEFASGHIPGAQLIPLGELARRKADLDPRRPTIVYCKMGGRGMAGAGILQSAGFDVVNLRGGFLAWEGHAVDGLPAAGQAWFRASTTVEELLEQLYHLEEGARRFYARAAERVAPELRAAFARLVEAEAEHKDEVIELYRRVVGREPHFDTDGTPERIEGGQRLDEALAWLDRQDTTTIVEMAMALEATAYDRYSQLARLAPDPAHRPVFAEMAEGERRHLEEVTGLLRS